MGAKFLPAFLGLLLGAACRTSGAIPPQESRAVRAACSSLSSAQRHRLQGILDRAVAGNEGFGGGILRLDSTACGLLWEGAAGRRSHASNALVAPDDLFEIASITKLFTSVTVLGLLEARGIGLDSPVVQVAPPHLLDGLLVWQGQDESGSITWRELLAHRSGLPDYWNDPPFVQDDSNAFLQAFLGDAGHFWQPSLVLDYVRRLTPVGPPGGRFHYADSNYVLLGLLVEHLTGRPLHDVMQQQIFEPCHIRHTFMSFRQAVPVSSALTQRYEGERNLSEDRRQTADWAGGGLISSSGDLVIFINALRDGHLLSARAVQALQTWLPTEEAEVDYGLGAFRILLQSPDDALWGHDGHGNSFMYTAPRRGISVTGTLNQTQNSWWPLVVEALGVLDG